MVLRINVLKLQNFKTYLNAEFSFTTGHNVILGENGAGKSSLFEAITFSLYGSVPGKKIKTMIRHGKQKMEVTLEFSVDGERYRVERTATARVTTAELYKIPSRKPMAEKSKTVGVEIEKIIGVDGNVFNNVVYIPQGQIAAIASEKASERRTLFDNMLGYSLYKKMHERLRIVVKSTDNELSSSSKRIEDFKEDILKKEQLEDDLEKLEIDSNKRILELEGLEPTLKNKLVLFEDLTQIKQLIDNLKVKCETLKDTIENQQSNLSETQKSIKNDQKLDVSLEINEIQTLLVDLDRKKREITKKISILEKEVDSGKKSTVELKGIIEQIENLSQQEKAVEEKITDLSSEFEEKLQNPEIFLKELHLELSESRSNKERFQKNLEEVIESDKQFSVLKKQSEQIEKELISDQDLIKKIETEITKERALMDRDLEKEKKENSLSLKQTQQEITTKKSIVHSLKDQKKKEMKFLDTIGKTKEKKCPLCGQEITPEHIKCISEEKKRQISIMTDKFTKLSKEVKTLTGILKNFEKERESLEKEGKKKVKLLSRVREMENHHKQVKEREIELKLCNEQMDQYESSSTVIRDLRGKIKKADEDQIAINSKISKLNKIKTLEEQLKGIILRIDEKQKEREKKQKDNLLLNLDGNLSNLEKLRKEEKVFITVIPHLKSMIKSIGLIKDSRDNLEGTLSTLQRERTQFDEKKFIKLKKDISKLEKKVTQNETLIKSIQKDQIPEKRKQLRDIAKKEKKLRAIKDQVKISQKKLDSLNLVRYISKNIVPILRRQHVLAISEYATEIFSYLMNNEEYEGIEIDEDYNLSIIQTGNKYDLTILSGGEQVIACLSIRLAIAKLLADQDIVLLDEPTVMLDAYRRKELVQVFENTKPVRQTLIVTHDTEFERVADTTFNIVKSAGQSRVIVEEIDQIVAQQKQYRTLTEQRFTQLEL